MRAAPLLHSGRDDGMVLRSTAGTPPLWPQRSPPVLRPLLARRPRLPRRDPMGRPSLGAVSVEQVAASSGVGFRSDRGPVLIGVMLSTALVAIDATVIATAVPSVGPARGCFAHSPCLFSLYLLAQAVTVPVYGKLADVFGRKPVMLF